MAHRLIGEKIMFAQFGATFAAVHSAAIGLCRFRIKAWVAAVCFGASLSGCMPTTVPLAGADPADPSVRVAGVGYRSTIAPYTRMRPATPAAWRKQNEQVAPSSKPGQ